MARDIGPEMLADMDEQRAHSTIDQHTYEARRVRVLELIRKGEAVEPTRGNKVSKWSSVAVLLLLTLLLFNGIAARKCCFRDPRGCLHCWFDLADQKALQDHAWSR